MKISDMTTNQAADALIRIVEPASNIIHDEKTMQMVESLANGSDSPVKYFAENLTIVVPLLIGEHRKDIYEIVATMAQKKYEDVAEQKFTETIKDIVGFWDKEFTDFLASLK